MKDAIQRAAGEQVSVTFDLKYRSGLIQADPTQVEQVLLDLVANACEATPGGGMVSIRVQNEFSSADVKNGIPEPNGYVVLEVSDTGAGMQPDVQLQIFEPHFTTKENGKQTGLGLAAVRAIVEQSGGHISVTSAPGKGSTFRVFFPLLQAAEIDHDPETGAAPMHWSDAILLVEDSEPVRTLIQKGLTQKGYDVISEPDGSHALARAKEYGERIKLIITDVEMPDMNGRELARRLSSIVPNANVLYISGYADDAILHHGMLESNAVFLQKPFKQDELERKVREVLSPPSKKGLRRFRAGDPTT